MHLTFQIYIGKHIYHRIITMAFNNTLSMAHQTALPKMFGPSSSRRVCVPVRAVAASDVVKTIKLKAQKVTPEAFAPFGQVRVCVRRALLRCAHVRRDAPQRFVCDA
jgi:hypothetical protein